MNPIEVVTEQKSQLGEGPVWDTALQAICWVDILRGQIHRFWPAGEKFQTLNVGEFVGAVALCKDGRMIAALKSGFAFVDQTTGRISTITATGENAPRNRFNDGKCDPAGRFWAGTMAHDDAVNAGNLYALDTDLTITKKISGTTISNGMAWTLSGKTYYHIDTPTAKVSAYDFDAATGTISNKRTALTIPKEDGYPDGMAIDAEDMLWIAHWNGGQITRWNPRTQKKLFSIQMPVTRITSCTFGGPSFTDLYITSSRKDLSASDLAAQPLSGSLFVIRNCGFAGLPANRFG